DLLLLEGVVEVVDLRGVELELAECQRDLLGVQRPGLATGFQQPLGFVRLQYFRDCRRPSPFPLLAHGCPPGLVTFRTRLRGCGTLARRPDGRHRPNGSFFGQWVPTPPSASR